MRNIHKAIAYVEHAMTRGLDRKATPPREKRKPPSYVWHAPTPTTEVRYPIEQVFKSRNKPMTNQLTVTTCALKVTAVLDAAAVATLPAPEGQSRSKLTINCDGKSYTASTNSLRKVKTTIAVNGAENIFVMAQGKLKNNEITECGIVAQVKVAKMAEGSQAT
jgi:hypothetical protein